MRTPRNTQGGKRNAPSRLRWLRQKTYKGGGLSTATTGTETPRSVAPPTTQGPVDQQAGVRVLPYSPYGGGLE